METRQDFLKKHIEETKHQPTTTKVANFFKGLYSLSPICRITEPKRYEIAIKLWHELDKYE